jgi:predicted enzyme related to lactoylglutathione lyase
MGIRRLDIGLVSASDALADFYAAALDVERLELMEFPFARLHRLQCGDALLKVMVPTTPPTVAPPAAQQWDITGIRYLTLWVDDLDPLVDRWTAAGGTVRTAVSDLRPAVRLAVLVDPDGNVVEAMEERS